MVCDRFIWRTDGLWLLHSIHASPEFATMMRFSGLRSWDSGPSGDITHDDNPVHSCCKFLLNQSSQTKLKPSIYFWRSDQLAHLLNPFSAVVARLSPIALAACKVKSKKMVLMWLWCRDKRCLFVRGRAESSSEIMTYTEEGAVIQGVPGFCKRLSGNSLNHIHTRHHPGSVKGMCTFFSYLINEWQKRLVCDDETL